MKILRISSIAAAVSIGLLSPCAHAVLERSGPNDPANGFPRWYQDTSGVSVELCLPQSQAELVDGHCLLLPGDPPVVPEVFPSAFFDEHFWWAANASLTPANGGVAQLVLALEAAFAADVTPGGQIVFTRIRVRLDPVPATGTYRFIHPYGEEAIEAVAGDSIFFTDDVGISCPPGDFTCAMQGRVGPFLLPSPIPGGVEEAAVAGPVPGKLYIADPLRLGPVTGSLLPDFLGNDGLLHNHNVFRIEGPPGSNLDGAGSAFIETSDFSLMGRLHTGQMPSLATIDRASYTRTPTDRSVDVFATAFPSAGTRLPGGARPAGVAPLMSFYNAPCGTTLDDLGNVIGYIAPTGAIETLMLAEGNARWAQFQPEAGDPIPDSVCVKDNSATDAQGQPVPAYHQVPVNDEVAIADAFYDPLTRTLTVSATSSDLVAPPTLTLMDFDADLIGDTVTIENVTAPPARVRVISSARGTDVEDVQTGLGTGPGGGVTQVTAGNDAATTSEDVAVVIPAIGNDTLNGGPIDPAATPVIMAIIVNSPTGTAVPNNATGGITYTPRANVNGVDSFTYTVTADGVTSNVATVTVSIGAVNDAPVGIADSSGGAVGTPLTISVLANDTDVDGDSLSIAVGSVTAPTGPVGTTSSATANANGTITFTANGVGSYSFSYSVTDGTLVSPPVPVTVTMSSPETVNAGTVDYITSKNRWKVTGTTSVAANHAMTLKFTGAVAGGAPCNADGRVIGTTTSAAGSFTFDIPNATGPLDPRTTNCNAVRVESAAGGVDPTTPIRLK